jgi:AcrR family transcriptional regulator
MPETNNNPEVQPDARERLLAAALQLFTQRGYAAATVREIVAAAGVTKPVLYYYFKNKEDLYLELMQEPYVRFGEILEKCRTGGCSAGERLLILCDRVFHLFVENLDASRLMYAIYYGPPQGAPFVDFEQYHLKLHRVVGEIIAAGVAAGEFRKEPVDDMTVILVGSLNMVLEEQLCQHAPSIGSHGLARIVRLVLRSFSAGLSSSPATG